MGYVHDAETFIHISPQKMHFTNATYSDAAGAVADTIAKLKTAADNTSTVSIPISPPASKKEHKGAYITSINIWYDVTTADLDALDALVNLVTLGADGAVPTVAAQTFTYDAGHDTAAERIDQDEHKMTLTITTPFWLDDGEQLIVKLTVNAALTSVFRIRGAQANFTFRM